MTRGKGDGGLIQESYDYFVARETIRAMRIELAVTQRKVDIALKSLRQHFTETHNKGEHNECIYT